MSTVAGTFMVVVLLCLWWAELTTSYNPDEDPDVHCLKSIKDSVEDPHNILSTWNFNINNGGIYMICGFAGIYCWSSEGKVMRIDLSDMGLKGHFPPELGSCKSLTSLDLSNNNLTGPIPRDISKSIPYIVELDLSNNNFSGEIPSDLGNCSYLNYLDLGRNQLTGEIPRELRQLSRLAYFNVSGNILSGEVPDFLVEKFGVYSYANNEGLCWGGLDSESKDAGEEKGVQEKRSYAKAYDS
ncbi:inactive LRR receptor-like serine/threonine-protein kinase BIR2 [Rutidosis leptorrhynchoides]|uniref:inactive LRR receptor-like serine/threonine-protein kinase BIR2 n=1 Tax=Rutidosis leptorrhynchoides TaxID=125765 RepID=UPI003A9A3148